MGFIIKSIYILHGLSRYSTLSVGDVMQKLDVDSLFQAILSYTLPATRVRYPLVPK